MFEGLVVIVLFGFWIWALLDVVATDPRECRNLPKVAWLLVVVLLFDVGALVWLLLGRPAHRSWRPGITDFSAPRRPVAYEDRPAVTTRLDISDRKSAELDRRLEEWEAEERARRDRDERGDS